MPSRSPVAKRTLQYADVLPIHMQSVENSISKEVLRERLSVLCPAQWFLQRKIFKSLLKSQPSALRGQLPDPYLNEGGVKGVNGVNGVKVNGRKMKKRFESEGRKTLDQNTIE